MDHVGDYATWPEKDVVPNREHPYPKIWKKGTVDIHNGHPLCKKVGILS
jgi:hypothetical protein